MIKKIICWLFGHKALREWFTNPSRGQIVWHRHYYKACPRCGAKLGD